MRRAQNKKKLSREEKAKIIYDKLMESAAEIVSREGYAATSIAKVTLKAGVSYGTFYNKFEDRQALFDALLPYIGARMMEQIARNIPGNLSGSERDIARFRNYCQFLEDNPGFYRILYEAEVFAPAAYSIHMDRIIAGYRRSLERAMEAGEIRKMSPEELGDTVAILVGARAYISMRYKKTGKIPASATEAYARLVRTGIFN